MYEFIKVERLSKVTKNKYEINPQGNIFGIKMRKNGIDYIALCGSINPYFEDEVLKIEYKICTFNLLDEIIFNQLDLAYVSNINYCNALGVKVEKSEALNEDGNVKAGYYKHFDFWNNAIALNSNTSIYEGIINDLKLRYCGVAFTI